MIQPRHHNNNKDKEVQITTIGFINLYNSNKTNSNIIAITNTNENNNSDNEVQTISIGIINLDTMNNTNSTNTDSNNNNNNNNTVIEINSNNNEIINDENDNNIKYIFQIKFNYPVAKDNNTVILKKEHENKFIWSWSNSYPPELRDYISKEDYEKDIMLINGLKSYYSFVVALFSFWVLFFFIMCFVGLVPKFSPIILGLFAPFLFFSIVNLVWQCKKREGIYINYIENKLLSINAKYRDVNITWRLCKQRWINFYRVKKLKTWIEITLPNTPMELTPSYPPFSNIELSMDKIENLDY